MYYTVIESKSYYILADNVRRLFESGWVAQGGISITAYGSGLWYAQAMVKGETE